MKMQPPLTKTQLSLAIVTRILQFQLKRMNQVKTKKHHTQVPKIRPTKNRMHVNNVIKHLIMHQIYHDTK